MNTPACRVRASRAEGTTGLGRESPDMKATATAGGENDAMPTSALPSAPAAGTHCTAYGTDQELLAVTNQLLEAMAKARAA